jgi:uncharacterized membrane protein YkoI
MNLRVLPLLLLSVALAATTAMPAQAQSLIDRRNPPGGDRQANGGISLDRAVQMAESRFGAKAVKATTVSNGERRVHQIRLIREGKVWTVNVDAETGDMY